MIDGRPGPPVILRFELFPRLTSDASNLAGIIIPRRVFFDVHARLHTSWILVDRARNAENMLESAGQPRIVK